MAISKKPKQPVAMAQKSRDPKRGQAKPSVMAGVAKKRNARRSEKSNY